MRKLHDLVQNGVNLRDSKLRLRRKSRDNSPKVVAAEGKEKNEPPKLMTPNGAPARRGIFATCSMAANHSIGGTAC